MALIALLASVAVGGLSLGGDASGWGLAPVSLAFSATGALLARRRPGNPVGWLLAAWGLVLAYQEFAQSYVGASLSRSDGLPGTGWVAWLATWVWQPGFGLLVFVLLLFPHGRLPSPRWRVLAWLTVVGLAWVAVSAAFSPAAQRLAFPRVSPVLHTPVSGVADFVFGFLRTVLLSVLVAAMASVLVRLRRSRGDERQQIKWVAYTVIVTVVLFLGGIAVSGTGVLGPVFGAIPVAVTIAVFRYRLYDIDRLISRTVSYAVVTGLLVGLYVSLITVVTRLLPSSNSVAVAGSTLAVAALFQPVRRRVQARVDRRFNPARYDAARTVEQFSARLRADVDLASLSADLVRTVHQTFEPSQVSLWIPAPMSQRPSPLPSR